METMTSTEFERARRPEQKEQRRNSILTAAREMLTTAPLREISLRELSRRIGLSKSNVIRYFPTREAIFFEVLNTEFDLWIDELDKELPARNATPEEVIDGWASSLSRRPLLCELVAALGNELERNIPTPDVREFKLANGAAQERLATLLTPRLGLKLSATKELVSSAIIVVAGLWPFSIPSNAVLKALEDERLQHSKVDFERRTSRILKLIYNGMVQESMRARSAE